MCKSVLINKKNIIIIKGSTYSWYNNLGIQKRINMGMMVNKLFLFSLKNLIKILKPIELKIKSKKKFFSVLDNLLLK